MAQQAGKGMESKKPNCTHSHPPAFLESPTMGPGDGGTPADPYLPNSQLHLLGPCSVWLVPSGPAVILSFE